MNNTQQTNAAETTSKTYAYAVVPSPGQYSNTSRVYAIYRTNNIGWAEASAARATHAHQAAMRRHGGTSGGYRVIAWNRHGRTIRGVDLDRADSVGSK